MNMWLYDLWLIERLLDQVDRQVQPVDRKPSGSS
jgi:hypothetical protein